MKNHILIFIFTALGFVLSFWTYPVVAPILDKALAEPYVCNVEAHLTDGRRTERNEDVWSTEFEERKVFAGVKFDKVFKSSDGEYFASTIHKKYKYVQMHCVRK